MSKELDVEVAEVIMGFRWFHCVAGTGIERNQLCSPRQAEVWRELGWSLTEIPSPPPADQFNDDTAALRYSTDINAAMRVEDRIAELGKRNDYVAHLWDQVGAVRDGVNFWTAQNLNAFWLCVHATAEQRCRAALAVFAEKDLSQ